MPVLLFERRSQQLTRFVRNIRRKGEEEEGVVYVRKRKCCRYVIGITAIDTGSLMIVGYDRRL